MFYVFVDNFACVNANCIHFGSVVYFYWNCNIPPSFPLINIFYTRYNKVKHSAPFGQKCPHLNPLKPQFFIAVPFNCKIRQFLLIGFHSVGKASKLKRFTRWCYFFQVWSIKQILTLFLFSASTYHRANWQIMQLLCLGVLAWMSECGFYVSYITQIVKL